MPVTHARIKFADGMLKTVPIEEIIEFKGNIPKTITSFNNRHFYNIVWKDEKNPDGVKLPILVGKLACGDEEAAKLEKKRISFPSITYSDLDQLSAEHSSAEAIVDVKESKLKKKTQKAQVHKAKLEAAGQVMEKLQKKKSSTARRRLIMDSSDESDESQEKSPSTHKCLRIDSSDETNLSQENNEVLPVKANASINSDELSDKEGRDINVKMHEKPSTAAVNETPGCSTSNASHSNENIETNFRDEQNEHGVAHDDDQAQKDLELILADSESSDEDDSISGKLPQNHLIENGNEQGEIRENGNEQGEIRENGNEEGDIREDGNEEGDIRENGNERGVIRENGNEHGDIRENGNERGVIRENGNEHGNIRENYNEEDPPIRQDRPRDWVLYIPRRRAQQYNLLDEQNLVHQVPIPDGGLDVPREVARNLSFLEEFDNKVYLGCSKAVDRDTWDFISSRSIWVYVRDCAGCLWSINQLVNRCIDRKRTIIQLQGRSPRKQLSPNKHRVLKELLNHYIELRPALEGKKQKLLKQMNKHGYVNLNHNLLVLENSLPPVESEHVLRYCNEVLESKVKYALTSHNGITYFGRLKYVSNEVAISLRISTNSVIFYKMAKSGCSYESFKLKKKRSNNSFALLDNGTYVKIVRFVLDEQNKMELTQCHTISTTSSFCSKFLKMRQITEIAESIITVPTQSILKICVCLKRDRKNELICELANMLHY
ncbi:hypothetical protein TKK_0005768 [Trichogramma kaykai]